MQQQITIPQAVQYVIQLIQAARFGEAEAILQQIIQQDPNHAEATHLLAYVANSTGRPEVSERYLRRAIELNPSNAIFHQNLGALLVNRKENTAAEQEFRLSMKLDPRYAEPVMKLGLLLEGKGELDQALEHYTKAIALNPQYAEAYCNAGDIHIKQNRFTEALTAYDHALRINPNLAEAYANRATALDKLKRENDACADLLRAVQLNPNMAPALAALGQILSRRREFEQSIAYYKRAIEIQPANVFFRSGLAIIYLRIGQYEQAVEHCRRAMEIDPTFIDPIVNLGLALTDLGEHEQALQSYEKALTLDPDCAGTHANRALIHLRLADFERGFADYDHRWRIPEFKDMALDYGCPRWDGSSPQGKTLIIWHEQGFGDTLHLIRYAKLLAGRGATVIAQVQPQLLGLLRNVAGISSLMTRADPIPKADFHTPMLSLPGLMKTRADTIPAEIPYIAADPALVEQWRTRLEPFDGFRVGIAWSGNPVLRLDHERSIPLAYFVPLSRVPGVQLFTLQVGAGTDQLAAVPMEVINLTSHIRDFSDTAGFIANLDLLITVDTAVLHLAGAMGKPAWALLQKWPDWRWQVDREDSPWYPTIRLFRQPKLRDWPSVFERVARELKQKVEANK